MFPVAGPMIVEVTKRHAGSALPDAPQIPEEPRPPGRSRHTLARALRSLADRLEPPRCTADHALRPHPQ